jgi:hypothetical protein
MRANIFGNSSIWVSKIAEFDAAIESVEKIAEKFTQKVIGVKFFHTIINKNSIFLQFFIVNFIAFQRLFQRTQNQHQIMCFWHPN